MFRPAPESIRGVAKGPVAAVEEQEVRILVVGDVEVDPAVAVQVGRDGPESVAVGPANPGRAGDVGERLVAVVAKQDVPDGPQFLGRAISADLPSSVTAESVVARPLPIAISANVEVEIAVVVEIEKGARSKTTCSG